jgi:hypothetical protein
VMSNRLTSPRSDIAVSSAGARWTGTVICRP